MVTPLRLDVDMSEAVVPCLQSCHLDSDAFQSSHVDGEGVQRANRSRRASRSLQIMTELQPATRQARQGTACRESDKSKTRGGGGTDFGGGGICLGGSVVCREQGDRGGSAPTGSTTVASGWVDEAIFLSKWGPLKAVAR